MNLIIHFHGKVVVPQHELFDEEMEPVECVDAQTLLRALQRGDIGYTITPDNLEVEEIDEIEVEDD